MKKAAGLSIFAILFVTPLLDASAVPVRRDGGKCATTGTKRVIAEQDGKKVDCLFDTCTFTKCKITDGKIDTSKCSTVTEYSNDRDCKPVKGRIINRRKLNSNSSGTIAAPPEIKKPRFPSKLRLKKGGAPLSRMKQ